MTDSRIELAALNAKALRDYIESTPEPHRRTYNLTETATAANLAVAIEHLQIAVEKAQGNPMFFTATRLQHMSALDLLAHLAPNNVSMTYCPHAESKA